MPPAIQKSNANHAVDDANNNVASTRTASQQKKPRVPVVPVDATAPFTVADLREAIPKHCWERSTLKSLSHVALDAIEIAIAFFMVHKATTYFTHPIVKSFLWLLFWFYQGTSFTGLWVLAHEAGHGAFSPSKIVNDVVGFIIHTVLTVPYFSWQASHAKHHAHTNHLDEDEPYIPEKKNDLSKSTTSSGIFAVWDMFIISTIGWYLYLGINASGPAPRQGKVVSHYDPWASIFHKKDRLKIVASDLGLMAWFYALYLTANQYGWMNLLFYYVIPLIVCNFYLTSITYLQHTDETVPHYDDEEWSWLRGALCSIDRTLGSFLDYKTHHIVDTHVCHHLFSHIPFYHAQEATKALRKVLGKYYVSDFETNFLVAYYRNLKKCRAVEPDLMDSKHPGIMWFNVEANRSLAAGRKQF